jgi:multidrug efflux pump
MVGEGAVRTVIARVPGGFGASDDFNNARSVFLKPWEERDKTTAGRRSRSSTRSSPSSRRARQRAVRSSLGRGRGQPVNFVIAGATYEDLARARDRIDRRGAVQSGNPQSRFRL